MSTTHIIGARVIDPASEHDAVGEITIDAGFSKDAEDTILDATGLIACPGFVDLYTRLREPGLTRKGSIASESHAALHAGFTSVLCSPDTDPVIDSTATVQLIRQYAAQAQGARVFPIAALTAGLAGEFLSELATLYAAGCVAAGNADRPMNDSGVLLSAMEYAATFDIPLILTLRDTRIAGAGCAHAGAIASRLGLLGIPVAAESVALAQAIELCRDTRCRLHISRLSSARAVELIADAKISGLPISADVGIHHLFFTDQHIADYDANFHSAVPFRSTSDRLALCEGLRTGVIDAVCSDHAPHDSDAKLAPFPSSEPGLSAYDAFLPLLLALPQWLDMPLIEVIAKVTTGPEQLLSGRPEYINNKDIVLIDPTHEFQLTQETMISAGHNTPFLSLRSVCDIDGNESMLSGRVQRIFLNGVVHRFC